MGRHGRVPVNAADNFADHGVTSKPFQDENLQRSVFAPTRLRAFDRGAWSIEGNDPSLSLCEASLPLARVCWQYLGAINLRLSEQGANEFSLGHNAMRHVHARQPFVTKSVLGHFCRGSVRETALAGALRGVGAIKAMETSCSNSSGMTVPNGAVSSAALTPGSTWAAMKPL
jgi:hypothetical protein